MSASRTVVADRERAYAFAAAKIGISRTEQMRGLVLLKDDEVIAATVYDEFNGSNIIMHCVGSPGRRWLNRWFLHEAFKYPFVTLGCHRITCQVEQTNEDSVRFLEHLGFEREAVLKEAGPNGQDVFLYVMFRKNCRHA